MSLGLIPGFELHPGLCRLPCLRSVMAHQLQCGPHIHGPGCGHQLIQHDDHVGYLHNGMLHCRVKRILVEHALPHDPEQVALCNPPHSHSDCEDGHEHSNTCGHSRIRHGNHYDFLVGDELHHVHDGHCDSHGNVKLRRFKPSALAAANECPPVLHRRHNLRRHAHVKKRKPWYKDRDLLRFAAMLCLTGSYFFIELIWGIAVSSLALMADAFHMLSDVMALMIGFYAVRVSKREKTDSHTFGWQRMETIGGLINGSFLIAFSFSIAIEAVQRFFEDDGHHNLGENATTLIYVATVGLAINVVGLVIFGHSHGEGGGHGHSHSHGGKSQPALHAWTEFYLTSGPFDRHEEEDDLLHDTDDYYDEEEDAEESGVELGEVVWHRAESDSYSSSAAVPASFAVFSPTGAAGTGPPSAASAAATPATAAALPPSVSAGSLAESKSSDPLLLCTSSSCGTGTAQPFPTTTEASSSAAAGFASPRPAHNAHAHGLPPPAAAKSPKSPKKRVKSPVAAAASGQQHGHGHSHGGAGAGAGPSCDLVDRTVEQEHHEPQYTEMEIEEDVDLDKLGPEPQFLTRRMSHSIARRMSHTGGHGHSHGGGGGLKNTNLNIRGVFLHVMGDALGSIAVIISGLIIKYTSSEHRFLADPICSLAIVIILLSSSIPLVKACVSVLLERVPKTVNLVTLKRELLSVPGCIEIHELHVWQLSSSRVVATLHAIVLEGSNFMRISDQMKLVLHRHGIHSTTIQPEFVTRGALDDLSSLGELCHEPLCSTSPECYTKFCCAPVPTIGTTPTSIVNRNMEAAALVEEEEHQRAAAAAAAAAAISPRRKDDVAAVRSPKGVPSPVGPGQQQQQQPQSAPFADPNMI